MTKLITRKTAIAAIISLTVAYPTIAAVPNTFVAGQPASAADVNENFTNLDSRVDVLESAAAEPAASIAINCTADANALKNADIKKDTTYNITGACAGPIYVEEDNVHLLGSNNATDSIVLPAGLDESAVFAGGAYNVQITNLFLDLTATTTANDTAGIWARGSYVRLRDSRIIGGSVGVNPFRGAIVRLDGENSITEFENAGLSASDQSNINTRGQTTVTSTRVDDQFMKGIRVTNGSSVDIGSGITVSVPTSTDARAINAENNSSVRIQNSGIVSLIGDVRSDKNSSVLVEKGSITGDLEVKESSTLTLQNGVDVTGDADVKDIGIWKMDGGSISGTIRVRRNSLTSLFNVDQSTDDNRAIRVDDNSTLIADGSNLGRALANKSSSLEIREDNDGDISTVKGIELGLGSIGSISSTSITSDINIYPSSVIGLTNGTNLNGYNIYGCNTPSFADDSVIGIGNPDTASDCP